MDATFGSDMQHGDERQGWSLPLFLVVSLALHGALLALWPMTPPQAGPSGLPMPLSIRLVTSPAPARQQQAAQNLAPRPATKTMPTRSQPRAPAAVAAGTTPVTATVQETVATAPAAIVAVQTEPASPAPATILASVQQRLADHFRYPLLAQRRGWEGEVLLGFSVDTDGSLHAIHVARSSGHPLLDRSALESLQQVQRLELLPGAALDLQLPVIYQLREG